MIYAISCTAEVAIGAARDRIEFVFADLAQIRLIQQPANVSPWFSSCQKNTETKAFRLNDRVPFGRLVSPLTQANVTTSRCKTGHSRHTAPQIVCERRLASVSGDPREHFAIHSSESFGPFRMSAKQTRLRSRGVSTGIRVANRCCRFAQAPANGLHPFGVKGAAGPLPQIQVSSRRSRTCSRIAL